MGLFSSSRKKEVTAVLPENPCCCRCGKKIKEHSRFMIIDGQVYCEKCGYAKRDWDLLELHALIDD